jgi:glycogen debranching enzyme
MPLQPLLHDLVSATCAPACALSGADGQIRETGVQGLFCGDRRVVSAAVLRIDGREPEPIAWTAEGPSTARFVAVLRWPAFPAVDPSVRLDRRRRVVPAGMSEEIRIVSSASRTIPMKVTLDVRCDLAYVQSVKGGHSAEALPFDAGLPGWSARGTTARLAAPEASLVDGVVHWDVLLKPGETITLHWSVEADDPQAVVAAPAHAVEWSRPEVVADDRRVTRLLAQSLDDLESLRLVEPVAPQDTFLAAGVPWFLTLFGRDSIWAARMLLPLGTDLAASTLRVLARRQGRAIDGHTGEAPGKILHELRREEFEIHDGGRLPPAYYGSVDGTLLWISLLHDAWRWGLAPETVENLLPAMLSALQWLDLYADPDGDGFVEYIDSTGYGLANQGWKDSGDAVRFRDGTRARPPIALAEVQAYAHQAAVHAAALLDAFGRPDGDKWRAYAADLASRFRKAFWVDGGYPALALDRDKRPVDALASNIGHLLGTGILSAEESARVATLLSSPELADGFGLRTMSTSDIAFNPLSYHCGSVWAHDTAIAIAGLAAEGHDQAAATLIEGLLVTAETFGYRLPELHGGDSCHDISRPVPYPAACRPQAWSAASAVSIVHTAVGLRPDVPGGVVDLRPLSGTLLGAVAASGLVVAGHPVSVTATGVEGLPGNLSVRLR